MTIQTMLLILRLFSKKKTRIKDLIIKRLVGYFIAAAVIMLLMLIFKLSFLNAELVCSGLSLFYFVSILTVFTIKGIKIKDFNKEVEKRKEERRNIKRANSILKEVEKANKRLLKDVVKK